MLPDQKQKPTGARPKPPRLSKKRARVRRARRIQRIATVSMIAVVALGLAGLGLWMLFDARPQTTVQTYPVAYQASIRALAAENGIDPAWPAAVILAESSYQPEAVSSANAQGLMQLLPDTAMWIAEKFGDTYAEGCLFDPQINLRYGCWYLGYLYRRFNGDMTCATAAYHAGQGQVDGWLANAEYSDDGSTLKRIPFDSTDTYVKRVLKYYEKYVQLYAQAD
ncbi:MAG: lytic transglycosylase domain-containing protein [Clostridia bacterium]|nr:lytic transglycosylase domain-containing protein [Clostridia bacterium]